GPSPRRGLHSLPIDGVRKLIICIGVALVAASCRDAPIQLRPPAPSLRLTRNAPTAFDLVTNGPVQALIRVARASAARTVVSRPSGWTAPGWESPPTTTTWRRRDRRWRP